MTAQRATRTIDARPEQVHDLLLDAMSLPAWNPALLSIQPSGHSAADYAIVMRPGLRGTWRYTRVDDLRIDVVWQVPGLTETGTWLLRPQGLAATSVTHEFRHEGALGRALRSAYAGVAELRLDRLADRVRQTLRPISR